MKVLHSRRWMSAVLLCCSLFMAIASSGCQTNLGGQSLPSANYLKDDVQFFPAGPETQLPRTRQAHAEFRALQAAQANY